MQFNLKSLKLPELTGRKLVIAVSVAIAFAVSFSGAYFYISKTAPPRGKIETNGPGHLNAPVAPSPPQKTEETKKTTASAGASLTDENPFKAEFLERFKKKYSRIEESAQIQKLPPIQPVQQLPVISPADRQQQQPDEGRGKLPLPVVKVLGVFKAKGRIGAITDKGFLSEGSSVDGYVVASVDMTGKIQFTQKEGRDGSDN